MPTPANRAKIQLVRGTYANISASIADLYDGELCYAKDQNRLYMVEGSTLTQVEADPEDIEGIIASIITAGTGIDVTHDDGSDTVTIDLANTAVTAGTYGSVEAVPVLTIDAQGRITSASEVAAPPVLVAVHNQSGADIAKGKPVYVSGTHPSGKPTVELADNDGTNTYPAIGLVYSAITNGGDGYVIISGLLNNISTNSYSAGSALYIDSTAGDLTATRPTAVNEKVQKVGLVARSHATNGSILIIGAGRTNDINNELVALTGVNLNESDLGTFSGTTISDNTNIKSALQELETKAEEALPKSGGQMTGNITFSGSQTVDGRDLSADGAKLDGIQAGAEVNAVTSVNSATGAVVLDADDIDDTSTTNKFVTAADVTALSTLSSDLAGKADLSGGKLSESQLPDLAIVDYLGSVASQTAMLGLTGEKGDWAIRSDDGKVYVITGTDPSVIGGWTALSYPTAAGTDLGSTTATNSVTVTSSTGTNATLAAATTSAAGVMTSSDKSKLDGVESGATADQSASEILTAIKTVDGSGSGLDADYLDGNEGSYYRNASNINAGTIGDAYLPATISSDITGNAATASSLATARTIGLSGDVSGSASFNGSANITISATVADDSHNHIISNVDGLQTTLDAKLPKSGGQMTGNITFSGAQTVDGRDLSADGAKLDGIESGATADQTASEILTAIKTVDGSGSGLDADTVDGLQASQFLRADAVDVSTQRIRFQANATNNWDAIDTTDTSRGCLEVYNDAVGGDAFMAFHVATDHALYFGLDGGINDLAVGGWSKGANSYRIWHAGNDGSGSGLDADTVDGVQASTFARKDQNNTFSQAQRCSFESQAYAATTTFNFANANNRYIQLTGNVTFANPTNLVAGQSGVIRIQQDTTGSRTASWGSYWKFPGGTAPTLTTTGSAYDVVAYFVESTTRITAQIINDVK